MRSNPDVDHAPAGWVEAGPERMPANLPIAVVDDDASAREAMVDLVNAMGFTAVGFASASAFLRSDHFAAVSCLIADVRMAVMGGVELCRYMAASGNPVPAILITAYPDETTKLQAKTLGIGSYLAKPCNPDELLRALHSALAE
jgi:FixJ family two-component response regulator